MYRNYYDEYTKRAEKITSAVRVQPREATEHSDRKDEHQSPCATSGALAATEQNKKPANTFFGLRGDDILLGILILFLIKEEKADMTLILALAFIFLSDLG